MAGLRWAAAAGQQQRRSTLWAARASWWGTRVVERSTLRDTAAAAEAGLGVSFCSTVQGRLKGWGHRPHVWPLSLLPALSPTPCASLAVPQWHENPEVRAAGSRASAVCLVFLLRETSAGVMCHTHGMRVQRGAQRCVQTASSCSHTQPLRHLQPQTPTHV